MEAKNTFPPPRLSPVLVASAGLTHQPATPQAPNVSVITAFPEDTGLSFKAPQEATPRTGVLVPEAPNFTATGPTRHGGKRKQTGAWSPGCGTRDSREGGGGRHRPPGWMCTSSEGWRLGLARGLIHAGPGPLQGTRTTGLPSVTKEPGTRGPVVSQQRVAASPRGPRGGGGGSPGGTFWK